MRNVDDVDSRLTLLLTEVADISEWTLDAAASCIRAAYGAGYVHAMTDAVPDPPEPRLLAELHARLPVP